MRSKISLFTRMMRDRTFGLFGVLKGSTPSPLTDQVSHKNHIARPVLRDTSTVCSFWERENILILGQSDGLFELSKDLAACGASVSFRFLTALQDLYHLPIDQYTMAIMTSGAKEQEFDVIDVGGILRRADPDLTLVWASELFKMSVIANNTTHAFCDLQLALPSSGDHMEALLR